MVEHRNSSNQTTSPDGINNADKLDFSAIMQQQVYKIQNFAQQW